MTQRKLFKLSSIKPSSADSVRERREESRDISRNPDLLTRCASEWYNLHTFRERRDRAYRYTYGDQWSDIVKTEDGYKTESDYIKSKGNIPLTNNLIRRLISTVVGTYVKQQTEPICTARDRDEQIIGEMMSITLQYNWQINKMKEDILSTLFEEFLISSMACVRECYDFKNGRKDVYTDLVNNNNIFFSSSMIDPRHWDISMIGMFHDITFKDLLSKFSKSSEDIAKLKELYSSTYSYNIEDTTDKHRNNNQDFYTPFFSGMCRVFEIWTLETKPRYLCHDWLKGEMYKIELEQLSQILLENKSRIEDGLLSGIEEEEIPLIDTEYIVDSFWWYQYLTPNGDILEEGETPYYHKSHPFTIKMFPFINGGLHSFVDDIIDQQRYINRMITLNDFIIRSSAKGVTMVDKRLLGEDITPEQFAQQWVEYDGMIFYEGKPGVEPPRQIAQNLTNIGATDMLQLQLRFIEEIAGVHGAMQGKTPHSGTSASLYAQQSANASTSIMNLLTRFASFENDIAIKKTKMIQQFYNHKMVINISGSGYNSVKEFDPVKVRDIEFDLAITESSTTPTHRLLANEYLMEFFKVGAIGIEMLLENGSFPFSDQLLQSINSAKEKAEATGQVPQIDLPQDIQQQIDNNQQQTASLEELLRRK